MNNTERARGLGRKKEREKKEKKKRREKERKKEKRGDRKGKSNDSPEIPDRREASDIPGLPSVEGGRE